MWHPLLMGDIITVHNKLYTAPVVAELFSVTSHTVRTWIREGQIDAVKFDGYWRISGRAIAAFAEQRGVPVSVTEVAG